MINVLLNDRYLILKPLAQGGFSETFLAKDHLLSTDRVVKRLKLSASPNAQALFESEIQTLYQLGHLNQNIPDLFDHFVEDQSLYLVQEFIDGQDLSQELNKPWSQTKIVTLLRQILTTLQFLHSHKVIHGDIKPRNIIRRQDGRLALIDFGAVKLTTPAAPAIIVGTAGYMPNEQHAGRSRYSSDIYALGMVAIQCITGVHPRALAEDPKTGEIQWQSNLNPQLVKIIEKMVRIRLRDRYASAKEVLVDLDHFEQRSHQTQRITQVFYESILCCVLVAGLLGVGKAFAPNSFFRLPIALQIISLSVPLSTVKALIKLRLW
jgi:eukaryotic-like serine/threonine-protein kinase